MLRFKFGRVALTGLLLFSATSTTNAGWLFGRKKDECCTTCQTEPPKEKKKCISASDPPEGNVVDVVGARFTTARANRINNDEKLKNADQPATPPAEVDLERIEKVEADINNLNKKIGKVDKEIGELHLEIQALIQAVKSK